MTSTTNQPLTTGPPARRLPARGDRLGALEAHPVDPVAVHVDDPGGQPSTGTVSPTAGTRPRVDITKPPIVS